MRYVTKLFRYAGYYFLSWFLAYFLILFLRGDSLDFGYFLEYLILGWTFTGLELPTLMWMFSIVIFLVVAFGVDPFVKERMAQKSKR